MKILYDHQIFENQDYGGISRYHYDLYNGLKQRGENVDIAVSHSNNRWLAGSEDFGSIQTFYDPLDKFVTAYDFPFKRSLFKYWIMLTKKKSPSQKNKELVLRELSNGDYDIFHPTYYDPFFMNHLNRTKLVITVHDLIPERFPEYFIGDPIQLSRRQIIEKADHIITVSNSTRDELFKYYDVDRSKVSMIRHGLSDIARREVSDSVLEDTTTSFLLYVGSRKNYKNFYFFISAVAPVLKKSNLKVICVGADFDEYECAFLDYLGLNSLIKSISVTDSELNSLYRNAQCLVFPSMDEGFGYPLIEAMAHGCPIICSDIQIFHEVLGDYPIYFHPKSRSSIRYALSEVLNEYQGNLDKGVQVNHSDYSLKTMIDNYINMYGRVYQFGAFS
ncbi:MAG: glycosyltransferase family 1 protein [Cytophagales bacterium]